VLSNHDGFITRGEFLGLLDEWQRERPAEFSQEGSSSGGGGLPSLSNSNNAAQLFDEFDSNRDGFLSRGDFFLLVRRHSEHKQAVLDQSLHSPPPASSHHQQQHQQQHQQYHHRQHQQHQQQHLQQEPRQQQHYHHGMRDSLVNLVFFLQKLLNSQK
jgi:Ca2+-binding EF-hand superfamily protein